MYSDKVENCDICND